MHCVTVFHVTGASCLLKTLRKTIMIQDAVCWLAPMEAILGGVVTKKHEALVTLTTIGEAERWRTRSQRSILISPSQS